MAVARSASAVRSFYAETRADEQSRGRGGRQQVAVAGKEKATLVRTFAVSGGRESAEEAIYVRTSRVEEGRETRAVHHRRYY